MTSSWCRRTSGSWARGTVRVHLAMPITGKWRIRIRLYRSRGCRRPTTGWKSRPKTKPSARKIKYIHQFKPSIRRLQRMPPQPKANSFWKISCQNRRRSYQGLPQACMKHIAHQVHHSSSGHRPTRQITNRQKQGECWLKPSRTRAITRQKWPELSWTREKAYQNQSFWAQNLNFLVHQDHVQGRPSYRDIQVEALALLPDTIMVKVGPQPAKNRVVWELHHTLGVAEETPKSHRQPSWAELRTSWT